MVIHLPWWLPAPPGIPRLVGVTNCLGTLPQIPQGTALRFNDRFSCKMLSIGRFIEGFFERYLSWLQGNLFDAYPAPQKDEIGQKMDVIKKEEIRCYTPNLGNALTIKYASCIDKNFDTKSYFVFARAFFSRYQF